MEKKSVDISDEIEIGQKKIIEATRFRNWYGVVDHDNNGTNDIAREIMLIKALFVMNEYHCQKMSLIID